MMPKVDTFEQDIVEEIKRKDASLTEISAASNNVGNDVLPPTRKPLFLILLASCFVILLLLGGVAYYYFTNTLLPPSSQEIPVKPSDVPKTTTELTKISPTLAINIGRFVTNVTKNDKGYILTINDYSSVFAYITRNEDEYIEELALLFSSPNQGALNASGTLPVARDTSLVAATNTSIVAATSTSLPAATSSKVTATSTKKAPTKTTSTKTASSTPKTSGTSTTTLATTTPAVSTTTTQAPEITGPHFTDVTISNQNMRVWKSGKRMLVYAFVGNNTLLVANSPEGILALKSAILR